MAVVNSKVNILFGEDIFAIERAKKELTESITRKFENVDINVFDCKEVVIDEVLLAVSSISMFSNARIVILVNFDEYNAASINRFVSALNSKDSFTNGSFVPDGTYIIITSFAKSQPAKKLDSSIVNVIEFKKKYEKDALAFIFNEVKRKNIRISRDAADMLLEYVGLDFQMLEAEIEKLVIYIGLSSKEITVTDIKDSIEASSAASVFGLCDFIALGKVSMAMNALNNLVDHGEVFQGIQGMIASHIRGLIDAKVLLDKSMNEFEAVNILSKGSKSNFRARKFVQQAKFLNMKMLLNAISKLSATDVDIKTGQCEHKLAARLCVYAITESFKDKRNRV